MDTKSSFLSLFERLEGFVGKLPGSLQKPILQEIVPLKDLFLRQRAPRFVLTGDPAAGSAGLFNAVFSAPVGPFRAGIGRRTRCRQPGGVAGFFPISDVASCASWTRAPPRPTRRWPTQPKPR